MTNKPAMALFAITLTVVPTYNYIQGVVRDYAGEMAASYQELVQMKEEREGTDD